MAASTWRDSGTDRPIRAPRSLPSTNRMRYANDDQSGNGRGSTGGLEGVRRGFISQVQTPVSFRTRLKVKNTRGMFK
eukprot:7029473-Pyramimonas_sp.AAC.1